MPVASGTTRSTWCATAGLGQVVRHLQTRIRVQAPEQDVVDALAEGGGVFVESEREPRPVRQEGTQPGARGDGSVFGRGSHGWHGSAGAGGGSHRCSDAGGRRAAAVRS